MSNARPRTFDNPVMTQADVDVHLTTSKKDRFPKEAVPVKVQ